MKPRELGVAVAGWLLVACGGVAPSTPAAGKAVAPRASASTLVGAEPGPLPLDATPLVAPEIAVPVAPLDSIPSRARVRPYQLPLERRRIVNLERDLLAKSIVADPDPAVASLLRDGVAVVPASTRHDLFTGAYQQLRDASIPTVVTADSVLHTYHLYYAEILKALETQALLPLLQGLVRGLYEQTLVLARRADGPLLEPARSELAYLSVARKLLDPSFELEPEVRDRVEQDLRAIDAHEQFAQSAVLGGSDHPYWEDFTQYRVRGHYTQSPDLTRYFKVAMWLGRMGHRVKYPAEVLQQALLVQAFKRARCRVGEEELSASDAHARLDRALRFMVGRSDDLTVVEVDPVLSAAVPPGSDLRRLADPPTMQALQAGLRRLRPPAILSSLAAQAGDPRAAETRADQTQALRLLGQRYAADSEILGKVVFGYVGLNPQHPYVAGRGYRCETLPVKTQQELCAQALEEGGVVDLCRTMPTALDVATALGSALAREYTRPGEGYCGYAAQRDSVASIWTQEQDRAPDTLYLAWLQALRPLLRPVSPGYPTFMQGRPYAKKSLRTALASWAELRHDTILYVKQSYTQRVVLESNTIRMGPLPEAYGIVEPQLELYVRLKRLTVQTRLVLEELQLLPPVVQKSLSEAETVFASLIDITQRELDAQPLSPEDEQFIKWFGARLEGLLTNLTLAITPPEVTERGTAATPRTTISGQDVAFKTTLIADVHTDANSGLTLEEGLGGVEWMLVVSRDPKGQLSVAVGPVFSYYEFVHPAADRLTDEQWRSSVDSAPAPRWWTHDEPLASGHALPRF